MDSRCRRESWLTCVLLPLPLFRTPFPNHFTLRPEEESKLRRPAVVRRKRSYFVIPETALFQGQNGYQLNSFDEAKGHARLLCQYDYNYCVLLHGYYFPHNRVDLVIILFVDGLA